MLASCSTVCPSWAQAQAHRSRECCSRVLFSLTTITANSTATATKTTGMPLSELNTRPICPDGPSQPGNERAHCAETLHSRFSWAAGHCLPSLASRCVQDHRSQEPLSLSALSSLKRGSIVTCQNMSRPQASMDTQLV